MGVTYDGLASPAVTVPWVGRILPNIGIAHAGLAGEDRAMPANAGGSDAISPRAPFRHQLAPLFSIVFLLATGCSRHLPETRDAGQVEDAGADAGLRIERLVFSVRYQLPDGGLVPLAFDAETRPEIEATRRLELSTNLAIRNYRIRLFDESDRAMSSDDRAEESGTRLDYQISLREPLQSGHHYVMVIEAQAAGSIEDAQGRSHADQRLEFQTSGPREKPTPPKRVKRRRRR
jgi:hypothetical protein